MTLDKTLVLCALVFIYTRDNNIELLENNNLCKVAQSCPTLYNPHDYPVHGILQVTLDWVAFLSPGDLPTWE